MGVEFDGDWLIQDAYVRKLYAHGYGVVRWGGKYCLHNFEDGREVGSYDTVEELNRMLKLLVED